MWPATMDDLGVADNGRCAKILGRHTKGNYGKPSNFGAGKPIHDQSRTAHTAKATAFLKVPRSIHHFAWYLDQFYLFWGKPWSIALWKGTTPFFEMRGWRWFFAMIMKHQPSRGILSRLSPHEDVRGYFIPQALHHVQTNTGYIIYIYIYVKEGIFPDRLTYFYSTKKNAFRNIYICVCQPGVDI